MQSGAFPESQQPLVGRQRERAVLRAGLGQAAGGLGVLALVGGEAGIGKTTLVADVVAAAAEREQLVLSGRCYDLETPPPYSAWLEVLRSYTPTGALPAAPSVLLDTDALGALRGADELRAVLYSFLSAVTAQGPALLVLEDLHWADQDSVDLLRYLTRRLDPLALLVVVTYRDVELGPAQPLYRMLPVLVREGRPLRIDLRRLDQEAVLELAAERYPGLPEGDAERLGDYLEHYAEGNPFFVEELLGLLEYEQALQRVGQHWRLGTLPAFPVPPLVRQVVEGRLEQLSAHSRRLLEMAAVLGVETPLDLWQTVSEIDDDTLALAIEEAVAAQALEQTSRANLLRFRHSLIHEVIYAGANPLHRRSWHRRTAEVLAAQAHADPAAVAHHFAQANDERAADWLIRAAQRAALAFAFQASVANYERALAILEQSRQRLPERVWLLCALAEAYRFTDIARARAYADQAVDLAGGLDDRALSALARWCHARVRGFHDENVLDDLRSAAAAYAELSEAERARIVQTSLRYVVSEATLAQELANYGQFAEALTYARRFLAATPTPTSRAQNIEFGNAHFGLALAQAALGEPEQARAAFERSRAYFRETDTYQMVSNCWYWELSTVLPVYYTDQPEERARLQSAEVQANLRSEVLHTAGDKRPVSTSETLILDGQWEECRRSAGARLHVPVSRVPSARKLAELDWRQGRRAQAWEHIRNVLPAGPDEAPGRRFFLHRQELQWIAAELALDEGNPVLARRWIEAYERWLAWSGKLSGSALPKLLWARYFTAQGDLVRARRHAQQALTCAGEPRQPLALLTAQRQLAQIALAAGQVQDALEFARVAVAIATDCGAPYELAAAQVVQAEALLAAGAAHDARPLLTAAHDTAERLEAQPLLERIDQLLTPLSEQPAPREIIPGGLSPRELEVLRLVARGLTDAEIANTLSISPRTVGGHLHSIYNKLDVGSRTAATRFAFDHGLV